jgi:hypothetical protein
MPDKCRKKTVSPSALYSLFENDAMNTAFSEPNTVHTFRCELLREYLDQATSGLIVTFFI